MLFVFVSYGLDHLTVLGVHGSLVTHVAEERILVHPFLVLVYCLHCVDVGFHHYLFAKVIGDPRATVFLFLILDWVTGQMIC